LSKLAAVRDSSGEPRSLISFFFVLSCEIDFKQKLGSLNNGGAKFDWAGFFGFFFLFGQRAAPLPP
jgi:hypothetical protein